ncbi:MAG: hypothetical protein J6D21_10040 [Clostridia bacterium]|nr:hypothetical protein [Clostridia bacterium]
MKHETTKDMKRIGKTRFWAVLGAVACVSLIYILILTAIGAGWFGSLQITPESVQSVVEAHEVSGK